MDITINKYLDYSKLKNFVRQQYNVNCFLLYEGINDWNDFQQEKYIVSYFQLEEHLNRSGISLFLPEDTVLPAIENFSFKLSQYFDCSVFCDASRVVFSKSPYYSLLYEGNRVYLVNDYCFEETGWVSKIIELNYSLPEINLRSL